MKVSSLKFLGFGFTLAAAMMVSNQARAESGVMECTHGTQVTAFIIRINIDSTLYDYQCKSGKDVYDLSVSSIVSPGFGVTLPGKIKIPYFGIGKPEGSFYGSELVLHLGVGGQTGIMSDGKMMMFPAGVGLGGDAALSLVTKYTFVKREKNVNLAKGAESSSDRPMNSGDGVGKEVVQAEATPAPAEVTSAPAN